MEIGDEISLWNREEERTDEDDSSGDGGQDQRIDIQREGQWNVSKIKRFIEALKQMEKEYLALVSQNY
ncbi:MAG: hypothetical protein EZS28_050837 [Streblomastix strix]|uniref:Uncharacterized protein n=1 Tax=Streblomastix strix TaxID=222440 RepID=A0A5J4T5F5_9EUKA|nr:MAG: hypothetical protein EZS28_050837 [Streblomastix strix]